MKYSLIIPAYHATHELVDLTCACIHSQIEDLQLILIADNAPYTVNVNSGLKAATGDILIIGNNDITFPEKWLTELVQPLNNGYDVATCWTSDQKYILEDKIEDNAKFGSLFAMKRQVYEIVGDFDEQFKGYFADDDYRQRILAQGLTIGKNCNFVVDHIAKATYTLTDPEDEEFKKAKLLYEIKHGLE